MTNQEQQTQSTRVAHNKTNSATAATAPTTTSTASTAAAKIELADQSANQAQQSAVAGQHEKQQHQHHLGHPADANCCASCLTPIKDRFIFNVINQNFHQDCVRCADCSVGLNEKCFTQNGKLYCRLDYWRRFGPKCSACSESIKPTEFVQKLKQDLIYHLSCFVCQDCKRHLQAGEQLHLLNDKRILCKRDFLNSQQQQALNATTTTSTITTTTTTTTTTSTPCNQQTATQSAAVAKSPPTMSNGLPTDAPSDQHQNCENNHENSKSHDKLTALNNGSANLQKSRMQVGRTNGNTGVSLIAATALVDRPNSNEVDDDDELDERDEPDELDGLDEDGASSLGADSDQSHATTNGTDQNDAGRTSGQRKGNSAPGATKLDADDCNEDLVDTNGKRRGHRTTIKPKQFETLKRGFESAAKPSRHIRDQLAQEAGLNMRVIQGSGAVHHHHGGGEHQSQQSTGGGHKPTRVRTVLNEKQLQTLRDCYAQNPRPDALMKEQLVDMTGLSPRVIRVWFQNKRCKDKKKSILYKQMQQHEKDGRHLTGLTHIRGVPMVAASPIHYQDDHSMGADNTPLSAAAGSAEPASPQGQQQQQHRRQSATVQSPPQPNQPVDIHAYQPPWKGLVEYAQQAAPGAAQQPDRLNASSPRYVQLIGQIHGYGGAAPTTCDHQVGGELNPAQQQQQQFGGSQAPANAYPQAPPPPPQPPQQQQQQQQPPPPHHIQLQQQQLHHQQHHHHQTNHHLHLSHHHLHHQAQQQAHLAQVVSPMAGHHANQFQH